MTLGRRALTPATLALCASACIVTKTAISATFVFEATDDFPVIDAGEVPYYSEAPGRNALAINAGNVNFRDKFARATMIFEGPSGFFDITLTTLAELDGEAPYRVLINDVLVGSATNPEVSSDYTIVQHTFEQIVVPEGATIAVESLANTNGKIPEGDGTAFARGRWTTLAFSNDDEETPPEDNIDLSISASASAPQIVVGETYTLTIDIENATASAVATQPILTLTRPRAEVGVDTGSLESCTESGNDIICSLSEIPAEGKEQVSLTLTALEPSPAAPLRATVAADQTDSDPSNNSITLSLQIDAESETQEPPAPDIDNNGGDGTGGYAMLPEVTTDGDTASSSKSGGGAIGFLSLLILAVFGQRRYGQ